MNRPDKRDYVFVHDRPDATTVLAQLPGLFEDCNECHPHKAPRLKSRGEIIRSLHQPAACSVWPGNSTIAGHRTMHIEGLMNG